MTLIRTYLTKKQLLLWCVCIFWAWLIFWFSAAPATESGKQSGEVISFIIKTFHLSPAVVRAVSAYAQPVIRKCAHIGIYTVFGCFVYMLMCSYELKRVRLYAFIACACYAVSDEVHQIFVPGRAFMFRDILFDSSGAVIGIFVTAFLRGLRHKRKK